MSVENMLAHREKAFILKLLERSRSRYELTSPRQYELGNMERDYFVFGHYDYGEAKNALASVAELNSGKVMRALFNIITEECAPDDEFSKWLAVMEFYASIMRFPYQCEPMLAPGEELMHPLALLLLGEARCGKTARIICELAMFNGYKARVVCAAAHMVAEVFWNGKWHCIDADANIPAARLRELGDLPGMEELSRNPWLLDTLPFRTGGRRGISALRTLDGRIVEKKRDALPAFSIKRSSVYFGREYFHNIFSGDRSRPRNGLTLWSKDHDYEAWEKSPRFGWEKASFTYSACRMIPVETVPPAPELALPSHAFYGAYTGEKELGVSFYPVQYPVYDSQAEKFEIRQVEEYEVRVSSKTRGWDYDYPLYDRMAVLEEEGGDVLIARNFRKEAGMLRLNIPAEKIIGYDNIYLEARSLVPSSHGVKEFVWPSREYRIMIA